MLDPLDDQFWGDEDGMLFEAMIGFLARAIAGGIVGGIGALADQGITVSFDLVNEAAQQFALTYGGQLVRGINDTSRSIVNQKVAEWIASGEPLPELTRSLAPWFGNTRAEAIAVTEVTRAFAEGNILAWRESGLVTGKKWRTARDDLVCPICQPLDGMVVSLDSNGFTTEPGDIGITAPPGHVRCRCWLTPFVEEVQ